MFFYFMNTGGQLRQYMYFVQTNNEKNPCPHNRRFGGATEAKCAQVYDACPAL